MINNLRFARAILWGCGVLLSGVLTTASFMFFVDQDRWGPAGFTEVFTIAEIPTELSEDTLVATMREVASTTGVNAYKMSPSAKGDVRGVDYYLFLGDASSVLGDVQDGTFPSFTAQFPATLQPASFLTRDRLLGAYAVQGDAQQAQQFVRALADHDVDASWVSSPPGPLLWPFFLVTSPWGVAVAILWIGLVLAMVNQSSVRFAIVGLRRASGEPLSRTVGAEFSAVLGPAVCFMVIMPGVLLLYSVFWAQGYQARSILHVGLLQAVIPLCAAVLALVIAGFTATHLSAGQIISGARPTRILATVSVIAIVTTATAVGLSSSSVVAALFDERDAQAADSYRSAHPELVQPALSYAITTDEADHIYDQLGQIYRSMEAHDAVYLTVSGSLDGFGTDSSDSWQQHTLVVNPAFIESLPAVNPNQVPQVSETVTASGELAVLVPSDQKSHSEQIRAAVQQWVDAQVSLSTASNAVDPTVTVINDVNLGVVPRLDYDDLDDPMYIVDPVLVVTDGTSGVVSNDFYAGLGAYTSRDDYLELLQDHAMSHAVVAMENIAQLSALEHADRQAELRVTLTGTVVMLFALVFGAAIFAAIHHARHRTAIFLLSSTGTNYLGTHGRFTVLTTVLALIPTLVGTIATQIPVSTRLSIVLGCGLIVVVTTAVTLRLLDKGINRSALELT